MESRPPRYSAGAIDKPALLCYSQIPNSKQCEGDACAMSQTDNGQNHSSPPRPPYKFIIGGSVIILVIVWLIISNAGLSSVYYLTVAELRAEGPSDRVRRVSGTIVGESINWNPRDLMLEFELEDDSGRLPVVYHGPQPDMFRDGAEAVVEGKYGVDGIFRASDLFLKCPSKYEDADSP